MRLITAAEEETEMVSRFVQLSSFTLLLLVAAVLTDECTKQECDETQLIPAFENQTVVLQSCDVCTDCPASEPQTVQAWWYYYWPNGSRTDDIRAAVLGRDYEINLLGHPSLVTPRGSHILYMNYLYLCEGVPSVLPDIGITLTPVDVTIEGPSKMPVSEGDSVVIRCETGLSDSRLVQTAFNFLGHKGICPSMQVHSGHSSWRVERNVSEPYTCGLHIDNIQPSDSGDYYCDVILPGTLNTLRSSTVHIEVASTNSDMLILETVIPSVGVLILVVPAVLITVVGCIVVHRHRRGPDHEDDPHRPAPDHEDDPHRPGADHEDDDPEDDAVKLLPHAAVAGAGVYSTSRPTAAASYRNRRLEESRSTEWSGSTQISSSLSSHPNDPGDNQLLLNHKERFSDNTTI